MNQNSKINVVEAILMGILIILADAAEALAPLAVSLPILGYILPILTPVMGFFISAIVIFWLIMKGVSVKRFLIGSGIELIPILNALPARSAAFLATLAEDWAPKSIKKITDVTAKITKPINK